MLPIARQPGSPRLERSVASARCPQRLAPLQTGDRLSRCQYCLSLDPLTSYHHSTGAQRNSEVERQRHIFNVPKVKGGLVFRRKLAASVHLSPAG